MFQLLHSTLPSYIHTANLFGVADSDIVSISFIWVSRNSQKCHRNFFTVFHFLITIHVAQDYIHCVLVNIFTKLLLIYSTQHSKANTFSWSTRTTWSQILKFNFQNNPLFFASTNEHFTHTHTQTQTHNDWIIVLFTSTSHKLTTQFYLLFIKFCSQRRITKWSKFIRISS